MKAIILAAGMGTRLNPLTLNYPKCLLEINKKSILEHQINLLNKNNIDKIEIITGYKSNKIESHIGNNVKYYFYPDFHKTNNLFTLNHHINLLNEELLILFSDVLISPEVFEKLLYSNDDFSLLVDTDKCDESTMRIKIKDNKIYDIGSHILPKDGDGNFIGIAKFTLEGVKLLKNKINFLTKTKQHINDYYTIAIAELANENCNINFVNVDGAPWLEIDTFEEYQHAKKEKFYVL